MRRILCRLSHAGETGIAKSGDSERRRGSLLVEQNAQKMPANVGRENATEEEAGAQVFGKGENSDCRREVESSGRGEIELGDMHRNREEEEETGAHVTPVIFSEEYNAPANRVSPCLQPIPHDLLRLYCAESGKPAKRDPIRNRRLGETRTNSSLGAGFAASSVGEGSTNRESIRPIREVGGRTTYMRSRLTPSDLPIDVSYSRSQEEQETRGPSCAQEVPIHRLNELVKSQGGGIVEKR